MCVCVCVCVDVLSLCVCPYGLGFYCAPWKCCTSGWGECGLLRSVLWLHADYKQDEVGRISSLCSTSGTSETNQCDLICQREIEACEQYVTELPRQTGAANVPLLFTCTRNNSNKEGGERKKSNLPCGSTAVTAGELNITHNSLGVLSRSADGRDGNITLGCNNKGF